MFQKIRDAFRYNKYIATTVRPLERDTVAAFLELTRPIFERHARRSNLKVSWDPPVVKISPLQDIRDLPAAMSLQVKRSYNTLSESAVRMTLTDQNDPEDVQRGVIGIFNNPRRGSLITFEVPSPVNNYIQSSQCLDYMLIHHRAYIIEAFEEAVPHLLNRKIREAMARVGIIVVMAGRPSGGPGA